MDAVVVGAVPPELGRRPDASRGAPVPLAGAAVPVVLAVVAVPVVVPVAVVPPDDGAMRAARPPLDEGAVLDVVVDAVVDVAADVVVVGAGRGVVVLVDVEGVVVVLVDVEGGRVVEGAVVGATVATAAAERLGWSVSVIVTSLPADMLCDDWRYPSISARASTIVSRGTSRVTGARPAGSPLMVIDAPGGLESTVTRTIVTGVGGVAAPATAGVVDGATDGVVGIIGTVGATEGADGVTIGVVGIPRLGPAAARICVCMPPMSKNQPAAPRATVEVPQRLTRPSAIHSPRRLFLGSSAGGT